ncbi:hypothetical protein BBBOND_0301750 [Babesia bigemina]|uniref:MACPF domain-containing protein n=1 Tax=Babesia bigemina TaxID=5866 RepID=A0A061D6G3_BABBI|nr:hypothetical protein BBBOND_0301750 [Babesia bigemina]CDR96271.1 hypothetical protein BBBOND_0301750 [Babesia bigemina]|eukprot:XP_012768457.1 hypothetical protein BBBOND_0301750 [Babesia bigemina]
MKLHIAVTQISIILITHMVTCVRNRQVPSPAAQLKQEIQSPASPSRNNSQSNKSKSEDVGYTTARKYHGSVGKIGDATVSGKEDEELSQGQPETPGNPAEINTPLSTLKDVKPVVGSDAEQCNLFDKFLRQPHEKIKGLEYLGCGYDVTKSRPFGDEESFVDTGYTQPVVQFQWSCAEGPKSPTTPIGVWVRKEASCHKGHSTHEIKNAEALASMFSEDVVSSFGAAAVSLTSQTEKKNVEKLEKFVKRHGYALKSKCAVFSTGMFLSAEWNPTRAFQNASNVLLEYENKGKCSKIDDYRTNGSCAGYYELWKSFFNNYGTHVIFRLTMGGKLLRIVENLEDNEAKEKSKERQSSFGVQLSIINANLSMSNKKEDGMRKALNDQSSKYFVMGGDNLTSFDSSDSLKKWMESVERNAMPIDIQLTPISQFIPKEIRSHFWMAFKVYNDVHK